MDSLSDYRSGEGGTLLRPLGPGCTLVAWEKLAVSG
jgi:hypothetical protein